MNVTLLVSNICKYKLLEYIVKLEGSKVQCIRPYRAEVITVLARVSRSFLSTFMVNRTKNIITLRTMSTDTTMAFRAAVAIF